MKTLRLLSLLEGTSLLLLLFIAVPVKRLLDHPELVQVIGPLHGLLFVLFNLLLINALFKSQLTTLQAFIGFLASLLPFGSYLYKAKVLNHLNSGDELVKHSE